MFVDASYDEIARVKARDRLGCLQLHGDEPPELLARFLPHAYKAVRVRDAESLDEARRFGGEHILLDAYVPGVPAAPARASTGSSRPSSRASASVTLAGGLDPGQRRGRGRARAAVLRRRRERRRDLARPKDPRKVRAFIAAAKGTLILRSSLQARFSRLPSPQPNDVELVRARQTRTSHSASLTRVRALRRVAIP